MSGPEEPSRRPRAGDVLEGRVRLLARRAGAAGEVWEGEHAILGIPVRVRWSAGLKMLHEARALAAMPHPGLPEVLDAGSVGGSWLAERLRGGTPLAVVLGRGAPPPLVESYGHIETLASALAHLDTLGLPPASLGPGAVWLADEPAGGPPRLWVDPIAGGGSELTEDVRRIVDALGGRRGPGSGTSRSGLASLDEAWPDSSALASEARQLRVERLAAAGQAQRRRIGGRYEVLNLLGAGGMGQAFRALDRIGGGVVCVKCAYQWSRAGGGAQELKREFRLLASLRHPNLVDVLDFGEDEDWGPFLVTALYEAAADLRAAAESLPEPGRLDLLEQLFDAVGYLHQQGVLHRDLKPANILVVQGRVRVVDFGLSSRTDEPLVRGVPTGTPGYMAPELLLGEAPSAASDLWAAGVVAYEILAGCRPFRSRFTVTPALALEGELPGHLADVIVPLLAADPADRPASAAGLATRLRSAREYSAAAARPIQVARFVGREAELAVVNSALGRLESGDGGWLPVVGQAGIGKSRLLAEARTRALLRSIAVVRTHAVPETRRANAVWAPVARWLHHFGAPDPTERAGLALLAPDLADAVPADGTPPPSTAGGDAAGHVRLTLVQMLNRAPRPMLILLDDVHWLPPDDRALLAALIEHCAARPILFLTAGRPDGTTGDPEAAHRLVLGPLSPAAARMLARLLHPAPDAAWVDAAEGLPLLLVEGLRDAASSGGAAPAGVAAVVARRKSILNHADHEVLELAAVLGRTVEAAVLTRALDYDPQPTLRRAAGAELLEWHQDALRFAHEGFRDAILAQLDDQRLAAAHERAANALLAEPDPDAARIAWHLARTARGAEAAEWSARAGLHALKAGRLREALRQLTAAGPGSDTWTRATRGYAIGQARYGLGDADGGTRAIREVAATLGHPVPNTRMAWLVYATREMFWLGWDRLVGGRVAADANRKLLQESFVILGIDGFTRNRPIEGLLLGIASLNRARAIGRWGAVARQYAGLQLVFGTIGLHRIALACGLSAAEAGARADDPVDRALGLAASAFYRIGIGEWTPGRALAEEAAVVFRSAGLLRNRDETDLALAWEAALRGDVEASERRYQTLLSNATSRGDRQMQAWAAYGLAVHALNGGRPTAALAWVTGLDDRDLGDRAAIHAIRSRAACLSGAHREAWDQVAAADRILGREVVARGAHLGTLELIVDVLTHLERAQPPELVAEAPLLRTVTASRLAHLRAHRRVTPLAEPGVQFFHARRLQDAGMRVEALATHAAGRQSAAALGMLGWVRRFDAEPIGP